MSERKDPLASALGGSDPYGTSKARALLLRLVSSADPEALAEATESFLRRLTLLEMVLERELEVEISSEQLEAFLARHGDEVEEETAKTAQLLYGRVATREGG
jgi:hypothetical protein